MNLACLRDILSEEERIQLLEDCKPLLVDNIGKYYEGGFYPGKQTHPTLHLHPKIGPILQKMIHRIHLATNEPLEIDKSWMNWTNGKETSIHHHGNYWYSVVYYLKTDTFWKWTNSGTYFEDYGFRKFPQNSLIFFQSDYIHGMPTYPLRLDRYTIAMNLNSPLDDKINAIS